MFFHGLESGPHGSKFKALKEKFPSIISPDFQGMRGIEERVAHAIKATEGQEGLLIVGSSFGGLVAGLLAHRFPERVAGYVLCAPAFHWDAVQEITNVPEKGVLIHGVSDDIVPIEASRAFAGTHAFDLLEVEDGHRLSSHRDLVVQVTAQMIEDIASSEQ